MTLAPWQSRSVADPAQAQPGNMMSVVGRLKRERDPIKAVTAIKSTGHAPVTCKGDKGESGRLGRPAIG